MFYLKNKILYVWIVIYTLSSLNVNGQLWSAYSNKVIKTLAVSDTLLIDTVGVQGVTIIGVEPNQYIVSGVNGKLCWVKKPQKDSVTIIYRRLAFNFSKVYQNKSLNIVDSVYRLGAGDIAKSNASSPFINYNQLESNGSYGRSISIGSNQNLISNSNFNLQLNGYLLDSIKIEAALTDNTIPFQPEGNTARLQEFDLISIKLSKNKKILQLGDYFVNNSNTYFLNFNKKVQGVIFQTTDNITSNLKNQLVTSISIAKGEFARNIINGIEGNQGPYRLVGNNGEQLFIVLAASEKVYVDNVLQERGENADYVINYNTNEITFMPRRLINQYSRIQVEFEYRTNNYLNSLLYVQDELQINKKWKINFNLYSNQDAKNQGYQQNLTADNKRLLAAVGDSTQLALVNNFSLDTFNANKILYFIKDTIWLGNKYDSVCVYSNDKSQALFSVSFSFVGTQKGDYKIKGGTSNGRVYEWVGSNQGDYSAVSLLVAPKMQQMLTLAATYQIDSFKVINTELVGSSYSPNTFSNIDNKYHQGMAAKMSYSEKRFFKNKKSIDTNQLVLNNNLHFEYVQAQFKPIAPFRTVEFGRDWNVPLVGSILDENLLKYSTSLFKKKLGDIAYDFDYYTRALSYKGFKNKIGYDYSNEIITIGAQASVMNSQDTGSKSQYFKPNFFIEYKLPKALRSTIGAKYVLEKNEIHNTTTDSLLNTSYNFDISTIFIRSNASKLLHYNLEYFKRKDYNVFLNQWQNQSYSDNYTAQIGLGEQTNHRLNMIATYRQLNIQDKNTVNIKPEESLIGRIAYDGIFWNQAMVISTLYNFSTGQEQKLNYTYVQVPAGQGQYFWTDYNNDGIQQLNEFSIGLYTDQRIYIRVFTPSDDYVKVNNANLNQSIMLEPSNFFDRNTKQTIPKLLSTLSNQFSVQITNKILSTEGLKTYNPLYKAIIDTSILQSNYAINNIFYINRRSSKWGIDYNFINNSNKQLLSYGLVQTQLLQHNVKTRWGINKMFSLNISGLNGYKQNTSGVKVGGNDYYISFVSIEPSLVWLYQSKVRLSLSAKHDQRLNQLANQKAYINSLIFDSRYSKSKIGILQFRFTFSNIDYNGLPNDPISFEMLDALKKGANFLWYFNWQRTIGKGMEMLIEYEGRKASTDAIIHTGKMSLRAIL